MLDPARQPDLYPSRNGGAESRFQRPDPVVYGRPATNDPYRLGADQLQQFEEQGFVVFDGLLQDWVAALFDEIPQLKSRLKGRPELVSEPDSGELRSIFDLHKHSRLFERLARDRRLLDIAQQLLGEEVYIHQSRLNVKPELHGRSFPWHSDFETWHVEDGVPKPRIVTGWIMLTENHPFNGPLMVIPGSHRVYVSCAGQTPQEHYRQSLKKQVLGTPSIEALSQLAERGMQSVTGRPGTLVFHEGNLMHCSPDNLSPWPRTNAFFVYNALSNRPVAPFGGTEPRPAYLAEREPQALKPLD